jgi:hypothetical protein
MVRSHGIAVPRVYAYSTDSANDVGAEYMIMENLPGKDLGDGFYDMPEKQRIRLMIQIAQMEAILFPIPLPASGSIYYSKGLAPGTVTAPILDRDGVKGLCICPCANHAWWHTERADLSVARGPCEFRNITLSQTC